MGKEGNTGWIRKGGTPVGAGTDGSALPPRPADIGSVDKRSSGTGVNSTPTTASGASGGERRPDPLPPK